MKKIAGVHVLALLAMLAVMPRAAAQTSAPDIQPLREQIEQRFEVLPLRAGLVLRPKQPSGRVRSIEITRGPVSLDGQPATGAELREVLGDDADLVLRLSYLSDDERRVFLGNTLRAPGSARVLEPPTPPTPPVAADRRAGERGSRRRRGPSDDDRVRIGGGVTVRTGEVVEGNVVAVGGGAHVDGEVRGDVVAIGGSVTLGPNAVVSNNVVVVGGQLRRDPLARIEGQVQEIGLGGVDFSRLSWPGGTIGSFGPMFGTTFALVGTLTRLAILCLLAALVILLGRTYAEQAGEQGAIHPVKSGAIGLLAQLLFLPVLVITVVVLCITIIGIPLLALIPFAIIGLMIVGLVGFAGVAARLGAFIVDRAGWSRDSYYFTTIVGVIALMIPAILARLVNFAGGIMFPFSVALSILGIFAEYLAWTIGFGAVALARFNPRRQLATPTLQAEGTS